MLKPYFIAYNIAILIRFCTNNDRLEPARHSIDSKLVLQAQTSRYLYLNLIKFAGVKKHLQNTE